MAPIRRYLRITPHSVLEVRIYLDNPADAHRWLLNERDPVLPRVIESVRPLVLPKLREENERNKGKAGKRKGVKDVVVEDDFEVSIFLTELSTRHSILTKRKSFAPKKGKVQSNSGRLTGTREEPMEVTDDGDGILIRQESTGEEEKPNMDHVPAAEEDLDDMNPRKRVQDSEEGLFVSEGSEGETSQAQKTPPSKRKRSLLTRENDGSGEDEKKKMAVNTTYSGFSIYGRILCLVVKRRGISKGKQLVGGAGQAMMEEWITSTQMAQNQMMDE